MMPFSIDSLVLAMVSPSRNSSPIQQGPVLPPIVLYSWIHGKAQMAGFFFTSNVDILIFKGMLCAYLVFGIGFSPVSLGCANHNLNHSCVPGRMSCFLWYSALAVATWDMFSPIDGCMLSTPANFLILSNSSITLVRSTPRLVLPS